MRWRRSGEGHLMSKDEDLAAALLAAARKAGAEAADALVVSAVSNGVGVCGGKLEEAERAEGLDLGLRVLIGLRQGLARLRCCSHC